MIARCQRTWLIDSLPKISTTGLLGMTATERERATEGSTHDSFRRLLSEYRTPILIILLLAFAWRVALVIGFPRTAFDEIRYTVPAVNMLAGRGFSLDESEPILPSEHTVPVYPLFIAAVYSVFAQDNS